MLDQRRRGEQTRGIRADDQVRLRQVGPDRARARREVRRRAAGHFLHLGGHLGFAGVVAHLDQGGERTAGGEADHPDLLRIDVPRTLRYGRRWGVAGRANGVILRSWIGTPRQNDQRK